MGILCIVPGRKCQKMDFWQWCGFVLFVLYLISRVFFLKPWKLVFRGDERAREVTVVCFFAPVQLMNSRSESSSLQTLPRLLHRLRHRLSLLLLLPTPFGECCHPGHSRAALQEQNSLHQLASMQGECL